MSPRIRLALADDQALVRLGLKALLSSFERLEIVIEAQNGQQLLDELETSPVDVILSDIRMPGMDGFQMLKRLQEMQLNIPVILLTTFDEPDFPLQAAANGAKGFCSKMPRLSSYSMPYCAWQTVKLYWRQLQPIKCASSTPTTTQHSPPIPSMIVKLLFCDY